MFRRIPPLTQVLVVALLCLVPFVGKAFHIDEPLFLRAAQQIVRHPLDPYGFKVSWFGATQPMPQAFKNPPLACYFSAATGTLFGFGEVPQHLAYLVGALALLWGTFRLAEECGVRPRLVALLVLFSPAFLVSALTVMCDITLTAFLVWSAVWWLRGVRNGHGRNFVLAGLCLALAYLTKFTAVLFVPLLVAHGLWACRGKWTWAIAPALGIATVAAYELWSAHLYGYGFLADAMAWSGSARAQFHIPALTMLLESLAFCGGCAMPLCLLAAQRWPRWLPWAGLASAFLVAMVALTAAAPRPGFDTFNTAFDWRQASVWVQGGILVALGFFVPGWLAASFRQPKATPSSVNREFLLGWVALIFLFGTVLNWTLNARSLLPLLPPLAVLLVSALEREGWLEKPRRCLWALVPGAIVGILILQGDWAGANAVRLEAETVHSQVQPHARRLYYAGAWGFGYYLANLGALPFEVSHPSLQPGDVMVTGSNVSAPEFSASRITLAGGFATPVHGLASTMNTRTHAGFYSAVWGALPFSFWPPPGREDCEIFTPK